MIHVEPGTIVVFADIACPWAHVAVHRLHQARRRLDQGARVALDLRAFPLELLNRRPTPKHIVDAEIPVVGGLEPSAGWQVWQDADHRYPVSTLLALEAVQAAKSQGLGVAAELDLALRRAFFAESRCITMRHVVIEVADACERVDTEALSEALDDGSARRALMDQARVAAGADVQGSPHLFMADGTDIHNPGIEMHWAGEHGKGFPVVTADRPGVYDELIRRAGAGAG